MPSAEKNINYRTPTLTALFHGDGYHLEKYFPELHQRHSTYSRSGFSDQYLFNSYQELNMGYDPKSVELSFGPLIDIVQKYVPLQNSKILEIGGASGLLAKYLQDKGANITLLETQENFVKKAQERGVVDARIYNGENLGGGIYAREKFAAVIANRVFEDIVMSEEETKRIMKQIKTVLEPGGLIIIGTKRKEAVWQNAIKTGTQLQLMDSKEFPDSNYIRQVCVYFK